MTAPLGIDINHLGGSSAKWKKKWFGGSPLTPGGGLWLWGDFDTPPFDKARQRRKFDPFVRQIREKVGKNDIKMYDSEDFRKFLPLKSAKHAFLRGETGPCCKALLRLKRDPFVRQNFKSRPLCKAKSSNALAKHLSVCHWLEIC